MTQHHVPMPSTRELVLEGVLFVLFVLGIFAFAVLCSCCCPRVPDPQPTPAVCSSLGPPPDELPVVLVRPGERGCPDGMARCIDAPNAAALAENVERLRAYAAVAWAKCGPPIHQRRNLLVDKPGEPARH